MMNNESLNNLRENLLNLRNKGLKELKIKGEFSAISITSIVTKETKHFVVFTNYDKPNEFTKVKEFQNSETAKIIAENFNQMLSEFN